MNIRVHSFIYSCIFDDGGCIASRPSYGPPIAIQLYSAIHRYTLYSYTALYTIQPLQSPSLSSASARGDFIAAALSRMPSSSSLSSSRSERRVACVAQTHIVAPPLQQTPIALVRRDARPRHRALAATRCPEPRLCMLQPASERCSTRSS